MVTQSKNILCNLLGLSAVSSSSDDIRSLMMMMMMMMTTTTTTTTTTEMVLETSVQYRHLTQLIAREDLIEFSCCES
jgi:hypothetical protein